MPEGNPYKEPSNLMGYQAEQRGKICGKRKSRNQIAIISMAKKRGMSEANKGRNSGEKNPFYGKQHTEATKQKMREAKERRQLIKAGLLPATVVTLKQTTARIATPKVRGLFWKGRKHSEETRRKMSEAHKRNREAGKQQHARGRGTVCRNPEEGYRLLITAVIVRALKDNAVSFFDTEAGKYYCDAIGVNPNILLKKSMRITQSNDLLSPSGSYRSVQKTKRR